MSGGGPRARGPPWRGLRTGPRVGAGRGFGRVHRRRPGKGPRPTRRVAHRAPPRRGGRMGRPATKAQPSARALYPLVFEIAPPRRRRTFPLSTPPRFYSCAPFGRFVFVAQQSLLLSLRRERRPRVFITYTCVAAKPNGDRFVCFVIACRLPFVNCFCFAL